MHVVVNREKQYPLPITHTRTLRPWERDNGFQKYTYPRLQMVSCHLL